MFTDVFGKTWYKGNLHTHTTNSDGAYTPEETIALYKSKGYDFLALTDHWFHGEGRQEKNFLLLNGTEFDVGSTVQEGIYHIVGIGMEKAPALTKRAPGLSAQKIIDEIHNVNGIAILAHPAWSLDRASEVAKLYGIDGCEIYNTTSGLPWNCRPYSGMFFDEMALLGHYLPCMAADDAHHYTGDETRSYIMVQADELTREGVLAAIRANRFYATQGPNFRVEIENGTVTVHTSPVQEVVFFTDTVWAGDRATVGENVTEATYKVQPTDTFVRMNLKRDLHVVVHKFDGQRSERFRKLHDIRDIPRRVVVDEHLLCGTGGQDGRVIGRREVCGLADDKFGRLFLGDFRKIDVGML